MIFICVGCFVYMLCGDNFWVLFIFDVIFEQ